MNEYSSIPVVLSSVSILFLWPPIAAQTNQITLPIASHDTLFGQSIERTMEFIQPDITDRGNTSGRTAGGSPRGLCKNVTLTALAPVLSGSASINGLDSQVNATNKLVLNFTAQARPTFWFHVSQNLDVLPLEFVLRDTNKNQLVRTRLSDSGHDQGIIEIPLPESFSDLELNTRYEWILETPCHLFVSGWIEQVPLDPSLSLQLADASPRDQAAIYANNGIWQDAVTLLGNLHRAHPGNTSLTDDWYSLLESVDLEDLAQQPLIDCCTLVTSEEEDAP